MKIHSSVTDPNGIIHPWVFDFELTFFDRQKFVWVEKLMYNWWWLSIPYALLYIIAVFIGRTWMTKRNKKFELREALIIWNTCLTIFSFWGACRCVPEFIHSLKHHGFLYSICDPSYYKGITGLW
jgi:elongation of very long chain fatty acids protein 6